MFFFSPFLQTIINNGVKGAIKLAPPRYTSGGRANFGKRGKQSTADIQSEVLSILDGAEGQVGVAC